MTRHELWSFSPAVVAPAGITVAPAPVGLRPTLRLMLVDGGIDNDQNPNERDGGVYTAEILTFVCSDGVDNDLDGQIDLADLGCADAFDFSEQPDCQDGLDNDGDGAIDYPSDGGCSASVDLSENDSTRTCDDGLDNDGDGFVDWDGAGIGAPDPQCNQAWKNREAVVVARPSCGLGIELAALLPLLSAARRRVRPRRGTRPT